MKNLPLTKGHVALVDDADYARLSRHSWYAHRARGCIYAARSVRTKWHGHLAHDSSAPGRSVVSTRSNGIATRFLHHVVLGIVRLKPGYVVDHANHNTLDCRRANLRICTVAQNNARQRPRPSKTSRYKGVTYQRGRNGFRSGFRASITHNGKRHHLGLFKHELAAVLAYNLAAIKHRGLMAFLNNWTGPSYLIENATFRIPESWKHLVRSSSSSLSANTET